MMMNQHQVTPDEAHTTDELTGMELDRITGGIRGNRGNETIRGSDGDDVIVRR